MSWQRLPGEKVVWRAGKGGVWFWSARIICGLIALAGIPIAVAMAVGGSFDPANALMGISACAASGLLLALAMTPPIGRAFLLTNRRLIRENHFGPADAIGLGAIESARAVAVRNEYGVASRTGSIVIVHGGGKKLKLHHVARAEDLLRILREAVFERRLDLDGLPEAGGACAPPLRSDVFLAERSWTGITEWGPVLIGPTRLIRAGGSRSPELCAAIRGLCASGVPGEQIEARVEQMAWKLGAPLVIPLAGARLELAGRVLCVASAQRREQIKLAKADARAASSFLAARARPFQEYR